MTMTMATSQQQQQRLGAPLTLDYAPNPHAQPAFSNPWASASPPPSAATASIASAPAASLYMASQQQPNLNHNLLAAKHQHARASTSSASSMTSYSSIPVGPPSSADLMAMNRLHSTSAPYPDAAYTTSGPAVASHFAPASSAPYDALGYAPASRTSSTFGVSPEADPARRISQQHTMRVQADERRSFADALDASHGMLAMSQETPRNIYGSRSDRSSVDSYGFPSTHSTSSSMSSNGNFSSYYGDSVSDYSTAGSDIESVNSRTLPRPPGIMTQMPPAPQSMMSQFNSKIPSTTQKKHKCKVCDKRFTRPSSLQTHMYSHTGEKPFTCEVEGCGRHFSVVSNLRRHRKVHRGDARSEAGSEDHHSE